MFPIPAWAIGVAAKERLDFTERLLAQRLDLARLVPPR